jgi:hypothetical protein
MSGAGGGGDYAGGDYAGVSRGDYAGGVLIKSILSQFKNFFHSR